ncbi:MAG TPA: hypothetical protein VGL58_08035 [Caulobacteraceae bacterium]|jgi:hypothetical protein
MHFTERLRPGIIAGEITTSVRIWKNLRVRLGGRYPMPPGEIEVTRIQEVDRYDITEAIALSGGFESLEDLLKVAQHGSGSRVFLIDFLYRERG